MVTMWVTILRGVYRHDFGGLHSTKKKAIAHAKAMFADSDRYHDIEVLELAVDEELWPKDRLGDIEKAKRKGWALEDRNRIIVTEHGGHSEW